MRFEILLTTLAVAVVTHAQYDSFFFATSETNWQCPDLPYNCVAPFACSHDATIDKYYCCIPGSTSDVCWTGSTTCSGNSTSTAGNGQLDCGSYCCLSNREECTQREGQINICWATATNPLEDVTETRMNKTYSSLAAASPSATELAFQLAQVTSSLTSTSASQSTTATTSSTTSTSSSTTTATSTPSSGSTLSGGAIAGIVIGAILGVALIVGVLWFFCFGKSRRGKTVTPSQEPYRQTGQYSDGPKYGGAVQQPVMAEMDAGPQTRPQLPGMQEYYAEADSKSSGTGGGYGHAQELPARGPNDLRE